MRRKYQRKIFKEKKKLKLIKCDKNLHTQEAQGKKKDWGRHCEGVGIFGLLLGGLSHHNPPPLSSFKCMAVVTMLVTISLQPFL